MRYLVEAGTILTETAERLGVARSIVERIFQGTPLDFPVIIGPTLPFRAHRAGMAGITLLGRVYLLRHAAQADTELLVLLRHEAEHVRQQRASRLFYARYAWAWLRAFARNVMLARSPRSAALRRAWYKAYRSIEAEREAYAAGDRARTLLLEASRRNAAEHAHGMHRPERTK